MLNELFKKTFQIIKFNLILVQPFLFFLLIIGFIMGALSKASGGGLAFVILMISMFGLIIAFISGWFNMFHKCIQNSLNENLKEAEKAERSLTLFNEFIPGIGQHFTKILFGSLIFVILLFIVFNLSGLIGDHLIGRPESFTSQDVVEALKSEAAQKKLIEQITPEDNLKLTKWQLLTLFSTGLLSYLTMFWLPAAIADNKNIFDAYLSSVRKVFKQPFKTLSLFILFWISMMLLAIFNTIAASNFFLQFVGLLAYVYIVVFFITMLFLYYEQYSENNSHSWTDSFR